MINPRTYQILAIARGLEFYAKTGQKVNSAWTPKNMMATATRLTNRKFKPRDYLTAATALRGLLEGTK